jgi:hypothetical protein
VAVVRLRDGSALRRSRLSFIYTSSVHPRNRPCALASLALCWWGGRCAMGCYCCRRRNVLPVNCNCRGLTCRSCLKCERHCECVKRRDPARRRYARPSAGSGGKTASTAKCPRDDGSSIAACSTVKPAAERCFRATAGSAARRCGVPVAGPRVRVGVRLRRRGWRGGRHGHRTPCARADLPWAHRHGIRPARTRPGQHVHCSGVIVAAAVATPHRPMMPKRSR